MMQIGLIDVDGHAKKKKFGATVYPNLALCKIARWFRQKGDNVEWYSPFRQHYDIVFMSKVFNFTPDYPYVINNAWRVEKGGTGYCIDVASMPETSPGDQVDYSCQLMTGIDRCQPDYSIYPHIPKDYAYGFLTRGCPNECKWCVVPRKEGHIRPYMDVDDIAIEGRNKLVLMDNNILAAGDYAHEQLDKIIARGYRVDFNQALDARLVTDDFARKLAKIKWLDNNRIRFGCDTKAQIAECERAIDLITSYGFTGQFFLYTMLNSNIKECYYRITYWWERMQEVRETHQGRPVYAYAQPYRDPDNPRHAIPQWQKDMAGWVNKKAHFVSCSFEEFEPRKGFKCFEYLKGII